MRCRAVLCCAVLCAEVWIAEAVITCSADAESRSRSARVRLSCWLSSVERCCSRASAARASPASALAASAARPARTSAPRTRCSAASCTDATYTHPPSSIGAAHARTHGRPTDRQVAAATPSREPCEPGRVPIAKALRVRACKQAWRGGAAATTRQPRTGSRRQMWVGAVRTALSS
jgi:hypothetical protein